MKQIVPRWFPAFLVMSVMFWLSAHPSEALPVFSWADTIVKKSGHVLGYGLLALTYWFALGMTYRRRWLVWVMAILYAVTDEYHQSFVQGRHASVWDVVIFDNVGVLFSLWWAGQILRAKQPSENTPRQL